MMDSCDSRSAVAILDTPTLSSVEGGSRILAFGWSARKSGLRAIAWRFVSLRMVVQLPRSIDV